MTAPSPAPTTVNGWRVLPLETGDAQSLLDDGATMLDRLAADPTPTLRWYRATTPALVLGRGQARLAVEAAPRLPVVQRLTGGGAVLLDEGLLSLDVLVPAGHRLLDGEMVAVFGRIGRAWARALDELGVADVSVHDGPATARRRGDARQRLLAAVCYATVGHGEVLAAGRKLVGLAQRRRRPGALIQCGLLRHWAPARLLTTLGADSADAGVHGAAVGLDDLLRPPPDDQAVMAAVQRAMTGDGDDDG